MRFLKLLVVMTALTVAVGMPTVVYSQSPHDEHAATPEKEKEALEPKGRGETAGPAPQAERPNRIVDIQVWGNRIISTNTILNKIKSQKGGPLLQATVNEDIKRLYGTGFFQDIKMEVEEKPDGYLLIVEVDEKPIVREIIIDGATAFDQDKLRKELKLIEGQILDRKVIKEGIEAIRKLYADKGFRFVNIDSEVDVNNKTKEAVVYIHILEGEKYKIKKIQFEGVKAFKLKQLKKLMKTKEDKWYTSGVFKESVFQKDLEKIQLFYQQEGYLDVRIEPRFEYDKEENKIFITIAVEEGRHYVTGEIRIEGNRLFPESEIWQQLEMLPALTYSQFYLSKDIERIRNYYNERGYMDARVVPEVRLNRDSGKVDVTYKIYEGDLYFVEKVIIRGNTKTKDMVIRRELRIRPGEQFDLKKIKTSKQRLENLGYFEEVTYDTQPSPSGTNRKDLIFRVKEKRTGELSFGGGISSIESFLGFAEISQRNFDLFNWPRFTGGGQSFSLRAQLGSITQDFSLSFVEPYLLNKPVSLGIDLFNIERNSLNVDFDEQRRGFSVTLSRLFKDVFRLGTGYTLESVKLHDISSDAPLTVRRFGSGNLLSRLRIFSSYDTRNSVFNPTQGILASLSGELVGSFLGGDQDFYVLQTSVTKYWSFFKKHVVEFRLRLGTSQEFGDSDEVPVFDRFFAGGLGTVRGFNYRRVGPKAAGDAIGGQTLAVVNLEYTFPLPKLDAFRGALFVDAGHVNPDSYNLDFGDISVSIGPGIKVKTPIGPVAFYYGFPIANRDTKDKNGRFEFSLSRGF